VDNISKSTGRLVESEVEVEEKTPVEGLIVKLKELFGEEGRLEVAREKLVMRCGDFSTNSALRLFDADLRKSVNLNLYNLTAAFNKVGLDTKKSVLSMVLRRFDSNFDGELSYSDVSDMFAPLLNAEAIKEFEKRQMFGISSPKNFLEKYTLDCIRDVFNSLLLVTQIAEGI